MHLVFVCFKFNALKCSVATQSEYTNKPNPSNISSALTDRKKIKTITSNICQAIPMNYDLDNSPALVQIEFMFPEHTDINVPRSRRKMLEL